MTFRVVTHKRWLADQFAPLGAVIDHGFDVDPETAMDTIWWAPGAWVASAAKAGVKLPLMSCGPDWLCNLPYEYRGRHVQNKVLSDIFPGKTRATFAKLPEAKHDAAPAKVYSDDCYLRATLSQFNFPADTVWQLQEPIEFVTEARFWIAHDKITAHSFYRVPDIIHRDLIWGGPFFDEWVTSASTVSYRNECLYRMQTMIRDLVNNVATPPGFVLDMGITADGEVLVVEANAAWSSGPYDGDPAGIYQAIVASHDFDGRYPEWSWRHNPVFNNVAPLKISKPAVRL